MLETVATLLSALSPFLGLIVYFFKKILDKIDSSHEQISKVTNEIKLIKANLASMEKDIEKARIFAEVIERHNVEIEVLRRDLVTCFNKLDKIQEKL